MLPSVFIFTKSPEWLRHQGIEMVMPVKYPLLFSGGEVNR
jgi:hypothetical protein